MNGSYLESNPDWHADASPWKAQQILGMLKRRRVAPQSVAEVGCGAGGVIAEMSRHLKATTFTGFEISPQACELARQHESDRLSIRNEDLLSNSNDFFDLLLCIDVVEHVEDCYGFLRDLRGKGILTVFHIPLDMSVETIARGHPIMELREKVGHLHYFDKITALAILSDTGYEIIDWHYTSVSTALPAGGFFEEILNIVRKATFKIDSNIAARFLGRYSLMVLAK